MPTKRTGEQPGDALEEEAFGAEPKHSHPPEEQPRSLSEIRSLRPPPPRPVVHWIAAAAVAALIVGGWLSAYLATRGGHPSPAAGEHRGATPSPASAGRSPP